MKRNKNETTEESTLNPKNSEPISPTRRQMRTSLTGRDLLNQEENTMSYDRRKCHKFQRKGFRTFERKTFYQIC